MNNNLIKKFMEFGVGSIFTLLLGFISSPIITRLISPEENGKFSMIGTITNLVLVIVTLGLDQSYVRFFYDEDEKNRSKLLKECIKIPLIVGIIVSSIFFIFYKPISMYIVEEESLFIIIVLILNLICSILSRFSMLQIRMKQKAKTYSLLNILLKVFNLIFIILIFLVYKNSYITLSLALVITNLLVLIISILIEKDVWFEKSKNINITIPKKEIFKYGVPLVFAMAITWFFQSIDKITIKQFVGYEQLGFYNGAMTIVALLNAVQTTFTTFWTPVAFEAYSKNPENTEFFTKVNKIITVLMLLIATGLIVGKDIIILLLGEKYRDAVFIFPYLVFMPIMYTISETTVLGINFTKNSRLHIYIAIISATFNLIGNLILVPMYGAKGAAISTGVAYIVFFICRTYFSSKYYKVNYNIKKFGVCTIIIYILATYSSFNKIDIIVLLLGLLSIMAIINLYRDVFKDILGIMSKKVLKYKINRSMD